MFEIGFTYNSPFSIWHRIFYSVLISWLYIRVIANTNNLLKLHPPLLGKKQTSSVDCFNVFWEKHSPRCWNLKDRHSYLKPRCVPVVWLFVSKGSWSACPVWQGNFLKSGFSVQCLWISGLCLWLVVYLLCCFPCWRREQWCWPRETSGGLLIAARGGQHDGELAVGSSSHPLTRCCGQTVTFEKEVPRIWSQLGASWLVKHLLVWSVQSNFVSGWKSHLNPCH